MTDDEKNWIGVFAGLAVVGLLIREKGVVYPDELTRDAFSIAKYMATELRRICDGTYDE